MSILAVDPYIRDTADPAEVSEITYALPARGARPRGPLPEHVLLKEPLDSITSAEAYDLLHTLAVDIRFPVFEAEHWTRSKREDIYFAAWGSVLPKLGFRLLEHTCARGLALPSRDVLEITYRQVLFYEVDRRSRLSDADRGNRARTSAAFTVEHWDPEYRERQRRRAQAGGRASKRKPVHDPAILEPLFGLSVRAQAEALGLPKSTVSDLRGRCWYYAI